MSFQKAFLDSYTSILMGDIDVKAYRKESFVYDEKMTRSLGGVPAPEGLLEKMDPKDDCRSAIALYEAFKCFSPLMASKTSIWAYLSHVDLFPYMQKRFPMILSDKCTVMYIREKFFQGTSNIIDSHLVGLWWSVYFSVDSKRSDKYELTRLLFSSPQSRTRILGHTMLFRHKEAMMGILGFFAEHPELSIDNQKRMYFVSRLFSSIGAYKQLAFMDRNYFKSELESRIDFLATF